MSENDRCPKCQSKMIVQDVDGKMRCLDCGFKWPQSKLPDEEKQEGDWPNEEESNDQSTP